MTQIREILAFPFFCLAIVFIFLDTFVIAGYDEAVDMIKMMTAGGSE